MVQASGPGRLIDEWRCLDLARQGDETSWRFLFHRHYKPLVRMTFCITGSLDTAHDLAQESFVRLLRVKIRHREGSFTAFLSTIAYRLALKERKRRSSRRNSEMVDLVDGAPSPLEEVIRDETQRVIFGVMQSLPGDHREILALRFFGGHSYEEIARITDVPIGTVKSRIFYSIKTCRERLQHKGVFT